MMRLPLAGFPDRVLAGVLARHPYRDAIIGDLYERRAEIESASGHRAARR